MVTTFVRNSPSGPLVELENENSGGISVLDYLVGDRTMVQAINAAFADTDPEAREIYFPPGTYAIDAACTCSVEGKTVRFVPGSLLDISLGGSFHFDGERMVVIGLTAEITDANVEEYDVVTVSGYESLVDYVVITALADVPNATLLRLSNDRITVQQAFLGGNNFSFKYALCLMDADDVSPVVSCNLIGLCFECRGTGNEVKNYGALLFLRAGATTVQDFSFFGHTTDVFDDGIIIVDGTRTLFINLRITQAGAALYGVYLSRAAEFNTFIGGQLTGRTNGTYLTASEAIHCEHAAGHLKLKDTSINGWDYGFAIYGTHDTPIVDGAVIAQNQSAAILIDSEITSGPDAGIWPVSGMTIHGMYFEYGAPGAGGRVMHLLTGELEGFEITGCLWGYETNAIFVEDTFTECSGGWIAGNRLIATLVGDAVMRPNATTDNVIFGPNQLNISSDIASGIHAEQVNNTPRSWLSTATANFANFLLAGASHELAFTVPKAAPGDTVNVTLAANVATLQGMQFSSWVHVAGQVRVRGTNTSAVNHTNVSGSISIVLTKLVAV